MSEKNDTTGNFPLKYRLKQTLKGRYNYPLK